MSYTKSILIGNLTRDPELRVTPNGKAVCQFSIASNRKISADREEVVFLDCEAWEKTGENINKHFTKGKPIFVEAFIRQDNWEDKSTKAKRSKLKFVVTSFQFIGGKGAEPEADKTADEAPHPPPPPAAKQPDKPDDIPF